MDNRRKHSKRVFAMLLAIIMCLSQAVTAAADEMPADEAAKETVSEETAPEVSEKEPAGSDEGAQAALKKAAVEASEETEEAATAVPEEAVPKKAAAAEAEPEEAAGEDLVSGNFYYNVNDDEKTVTITGFSGTQGGNLVIPDTINVEGKDYPVTKIDDEAFIGCSGFTGDLTIGNNVEEIGYSAFDGCSGFTGKLTIGNNVKEIGYSAFDGCSGFTGDLTIPDSVTTIYTYAFKGCSGFNENLTIGNNVEVIGSTAFFGCSGFTGDLTIPNSVVMIGEGAFYNCAGFTGILTIPESVSEIDKDAFHGCKNFSTISNNSAQSIPVSDFWNDDTLCFVSDKGEKLYQSYSFGIGNYVRKTLGDIDLKYEIKDGNAIITGHNDGIGATGELVIPASIKDKGQDYSVTKIQDHAFEGCSGLSGNLFIPNSVTDIGDKAFFGCNNISTISNNSSQSIPVSDIWNDDTVCFKSDDGTELVEGSFEKGNYARKVKPAGVSLNKTSLELSVGGSKTLTVTVSPDNAYDKVEWRSLSEDVATVDEHGVVTGIKPGEAVITAQIICPNEGGSYPHEPLECRVTVKEPESYFDYEVSDNKVIITRLKEGAEESGDLVIPATISGMDVTAIGDGAFMNCKGFTGTLTIPGNVTTIGEMAFFGCSSFTGELKIPDNVTTIGNQAFYGCSSFTGELTIPDSVETIGDSAFHECSNLSGNLTIGNNVTTIGQYAFCECSSLSGNLTIPDSVTTIGQWAFKGCSGFTGNLTIGNNVTTIGDNVFKGCSGFTGNLFIPESVTDIGSSAFYGCVYFTSISNNFSGDMGVGTFWNSDTVCFESDDGITELTGDDPIGKGNYVRKVTPTNVLLDKESLELSVGGSKTLTVTVSPDNAYDKVTWESIDSDVATVSNGVVKGIEPGETYITAQIITPDHFKYPWNGPLRCWVTVRGDRDIDLNYEIKDGKAIITGHKKGKEATGSLVIPDYINVNGRDYPVTAISDKAFQGCTKLGGTLTIGENVKTIGSQAFEACQFTGSLTIPNSVETIGSQAFSLCGFTGTLTIGESVKTIGSNAFEKCGFTGSLKIPDSVVKIDVDAFWGCKNLTGDLIIGKGLEKIEDSFPGGFTGNLVLSEGIKIIGSKAFSSSDFHGELKIPDSVETIEESAFAVCNNFDKLLLGKKVKTIGNSAFADCKALSGNLTIPGSVETIGKQAFQNCTGFTGNLTIPDSVTTIDINAFDGCTGFDGSLTLPGNVETIYSSAFENCNGFTGNLIIPDSVETIGGYAFSGCSGFTGLIIGKNVKTIEGAAFDNCTGLSGNLTIPDSVETIYGFAFLGCSGFNGNLTIPKNAKFTGDREFDGLYNITGIRNYSVSDLNVAWFWDKENDDKTVCFREADGTEITYPEDPEDPEAKWWFSPGVYERKIITPPTGVALNRDSLEIPIRSSETLKPIFSPVNNTYWDEVSWNSSDESVATVKDGVVTGIKRGNAVVTVTTVSGGFSASCNVTVIYVPVTGVSLNRSAVGMFPSETANLTATVAPENATFKDVRWFSSDEKIATVRGGVITAVSAGSAVITVSTNDGDFSASCSVTVYAKTTTHKVIFKDGENVLDTRFVENGKPVAEPDSPSKNGFIFIGWSDGTSIWNFTTPVNKDLTLIAKYKAEQAVVSENTGSGMDPTPVVDEPEKKGEKTAYKLYLVKGQTFTAGGKGWTTTDKKVANVAAKTGKITAKSNGTATVTNETTEYTVYVAAPAISKESKTVTVLVGQSAEVGINLQAVEDKENKYPITWYSANPKVAVVNGGMVTGVAKGSAKVTAYIGGMAYSATVKVIDTCKAPSKITGDKAEFSMNPLQSFNVKFDNSVLTVKKAVWSGDGMAEVKNKSGNVTGYENKVINITTSGKFTAIGPGTTTVTGTDKNSKTVTVTVTVVPVSTKGLAYITKGKTDTIKFPKVTNKKADWWKSSNEKAATVDTSKKDGKVKGIDYGTSDISCLYKGFTFNTPVYVEDPKMVFGGKEVKNKDKLEMKVGEMKQLKINKTYQTLNFKSSKQATAFVDENGFVYARKKGKANISTKINGTTYQIAIEVKE